MGSDLSKSVTCAIGEYLALAELLKRGHEAFIAQGPTQQGWDVAVIRKDGDTEKVIRVQVKTIDWPKDNRRTVTLSNALAFDYLIVVLLDLTQAQAGISFSRNLKLILWPHRKTRTGITNHDRGTSPRTLPNLTLLGFLKTNGRKLNEVHFINSIRRSLSRAVIHRLACLCPRHVLC